MVTLESDKACRCYFMRGIFFSLKNVISIFFSSWEFVQTPVLLKLCLNKSIFNREILCRHED